MAVEMETSLRLPAEWEAIRELMVGRSLGFLYWSVEYPWFEVMEDGMEVRSVVPFRLSSSPSSPSA